MKSGVNSLPSYLPGHDGTPGEYLRNLVDLLAAADGLGYDAIWVNEHHFHPFGGTISSPPVVLAALAQRTRRVRLGTSIALLPLHPPLAVAEQFATVDLMSGGRLDFGVGRGYVPYDYEALGLPYAEGQARTLEALEVILKAWSGQPVTHHGVYHDFDAVTVWPPPQQRPHPPVWFACANNPHSFAWTAQQGYHLLIIPYITSVERIAGFTRVYRAAWLAAGRDPATYEIGSLYQAVVAEDGAEARRVAERGMARYMEQNRAAQALSRVPSRIQREPLVIERLVDENRLIAGTPEHCARQIECLRDEIGFTAVNCMFQFGGIDFPTAHRSMELFAREVMPRLRATPAAAPTR